LRPLGPIYKVFKFVAGKFFSKIKKDLIRKPTESQDLMAVVAKSRAPKQKREKNHS
jgi:hypothetical protein